MEGSGPGWLDEIDLDPSSGWLAMKTRALGSRPWLIVDAKRDAELALKARLLLERPAEVFAARSGSEEPGRETLELVSAACRRLGLETGTDAGPGADGSDPVAPDPVDRHPLDLAGRLVQEDLCLLAPGPDGWVFQAASLCFPSRWRLADKLGRTQAGVHGPVEGYDSSLAPRVDRLFDRLGDRIVWRRNWFIHPNPELFQPDRPVGGDPVVEAGLCLTGLYLRSERQTLRRLARTGWILFTIRTQQEPLAALLADGGRRDRFARYLADGAEDQLAHRGISPPQAAALRRAMAA